MVAEPEPSSPDTAGVGLRSLPAPLHEELPASPDQLRVVRRQVRSWAQQAGLSDDKTTDLQLAVSEAAENAVEHAYIGQLAGKFSYSLAYTGDHVLVVEVRDHGRWKPPPDDPGFRGRGLVVIRDLATDFQLDSNDSGTHIRFAVPVNPDAAG